MKIRKLIESDTPVIKIANKLASKKTKEAKREENETTSDEEEPEEDESFLGIGGRVGIETDDY